jgi:hypothetical protein
VTDDLDLLAHALQALRPWHRSLVMVGGWAHRLYRFHPLADPPSYLPLQTRDADFAVAPTEPIVGDIAAALQAADFDAQLSGDERPPVARYHLHSDPGFFIEFLAPLTGSGVRRENTADATVVVGGVVAQKLRYVDLLLIEPWVVGLGEEVAVPLVPAAEIQLANPVMFIAQRLLIQKRRPPRKRAQDILYIHDTLDLFGPNIDELRRLWQDELRHRLPDATLRNVERLAQEHFGFLSDAIREAARIPQDRRPSPERIRELCAYGLGEVFGP